ncbi:hypothetical protein BX666DRAFT_1971420 [Dichotomocladium elegans]|nr:hypothetical protein BX666DRAFT_1971420 [Dichotomocladium elegans]
MSENDTDFLESEAEEYEVEAIAGHRKNRKKLGVDYLIKWKGYDESDNTWEHESNVHAPELIEAYWADKGGKEGQKAARMEKKKKKEESPRRRRSLINRKKEISTPKESHDLSASYDDIIPSPSSPTKRDSPSLDEESKKRLKPLPPKDMEEDEDKMNEDQVEKEAVEENMMKEDLSKEKEVEQSNRDLENKARPATSLDNFLIQKTLKEVNTDDIIFDSNYPPDGDSIDWEDEVASVEYMVCDPDDITVVYVVLRW